ncbi:MAG: ComEC/Rec2 family competence protein, partial [Lachnospiraceae bacterium]|nr:ComEC/Rec2 family competence protein [Lachnospiraceae bacterium]
MKSSKILSASDSPGLKTTKRADSHARKVFGNFHTGNTKDYFPPKRPLLVVAIAYLALSILYVNLFYVFPKLNITDKGLVTIQGKVSDISLNSDGSIASFVLKGVYKEKRIGINKGLDVLCYVNHSEGYASHYKRQNMDSVSSYVNMGPDDISPVFPGGIYEVSGKVRLYSNATNPGEFDIKRYYESHHVIYSITLSSVKCLRPAPGLLETFFKLRCFFLRQIRLNCPLEYGTINTILWADKSALQKDRKDLYQSVGLAHFLVISGLHIQILGTALYYLLKNLSIPRSICALTSMALILLYSLLVGFHVSVFRAIVMFSLRLLGDILKRPYDMLSALGLSTFLALIIDPFSILDNGFIYSYLCVLALSIYMEILSKNSKKYMVAVTVWLYLLPVNLFTNYKVSLISIFLNLVLGIFTGPLMIIGCFCFVLSLHNFVILAAICDFLFALLIRFMDKVCDIFNHFSALTILGKPNAIALFIYYLILLTFHIFGQKKASRFLENLLYLFLVLFISTNFSFAPFMTMLDVGQGQCIVVCYAPKKCIIYDIGSSSKNDISKRIIFPFLQSKGIYTVTDLYLSHSDSDHTNALSDFISDSES